MLESLPLAGNGDHSIANLRRNIVTVACFASAIGLNFKECFTDIAISFTVPHS
jgi:hypothetical protein